MVAYPKDWVQNFGDEYYKTKTSTEVNYTTSPTEITYKTDDALENCTSPEDLIKNINGIKETLYERNTTQ